MELRWQLFPKTVQLTENRFLVQLRPDGPDSVSLVEFDFYIFFRTSISPNQHLKPDFF